VEKYFSRLVHIFVFCEGSGKHGFEFGVRRGKKELVVAEAGDAEAALGVRDELPGRANPF
jgi:hypothetical protein